MNNRKIAVLTTCRADFGIMKSLILRMQKKQEIQCDVLVTGTHLSEDWGYTANEIIEEGIEITYKVPIVSNKKNDNHIDQEMAKALCKFSKIFLNEKYNMLIVLGDRYETLAVVIAAVNYHIPIAHIHGGEITEGALDDYYRHAITKMSFLHFTSTEEYKKRVIQMGEHPNRVFNVGALGVENVLGTTLFTKEELGTILNYDLCKNYAIVTFHPCTLEEFDLTKQVEELFDALFEIDDLNYFVTYANADEGGKIINNYLEKRLSGNERFLLVKSLGMKKYLSAVKYSTMVIGNSSSGIIEVPSFGVPTVNVGNRQKGRIQAESVINCEINKTCIMNAVQEALYMKNNKDLNTVNNPYMGANTAENIIKKIKEWLDHGIDLKKGFYDLS